MRTRGTRRQVRGRSPTGPTRGFFGCELTHVIEIVVKSALQKVSRRLGLGLGGHSTVLSVVPAVQAGQEATECHGNSSPGSGSKPHRISDISFLWTRGALVLDERRALILFVLRHRPGEKVPGFVGFGAVVFRPLVTWRAGEFDGIAQRPARDGRVVAVLVALGAVEIHLVTLRVADLAQLGQAEVGHLCPRVMRACGRHLRDVFLEVEFWFLGHLRTPRR